LQQRSWQASQASRRRTDLASVPGMAAAAARACGSRSSWRCATDAACVKLVAS